MQQLYKNFANNFYKTLIINLLKAGKLSLKQFNQDLCKIKQSNNGSNGKLITKYIKLNNNNKDKNAVYEKVEHDFK